MPRLWLQQAVPWLLTVLAVCALLLFWAQLYVVNVNLIQTGKSLQVDRNSIINKNLVDLSGVAAAVVVAVGVAYRTRKRSVPLLLQEISEAIGKGTSIEGGDGRGGAWGTIFSVVFKDILLLGKMGECEDFQQWLSHFLTMWGFIGLAVTTVADAVVNFAAVPLLLTNPVRLLGNAAGVVFVAGLTLSISRRLVHREVRMATRAGDWVFLASLYGTALTGFLVETFSDTSNVIGTTVTYPLHLAFIAFLLVTAPWTKFVHALWRPSWVVYSKLEGKRE